MFVKYKFGPYTLEKKIYNYRYYGLKGHDFIIVVQ